MERLTGGVCEVIASELRDGKAGNLAQKLNHATEREIGRKFRSHGIHVVEQVAHVVTDGQQHGCRIRGAPRRRG